MIYMQRLLTRLDRLATGRTITLFFGLTLGLNLFLQLRMLPLFATYAPGMSILDLRPLGYTAAYVNELFTALGEMGRHLYITQELPIDTVFPALYGLTFALILAALTRTGMRNQTLRAALVALPLVAAGFDYLENIGILFMLITFPDISPALVVLASSATVFKSILSIVFFLAILICGIRRAWITFRA